MTLPGPSVGGAGAILPRIAGGLSAVGGWAVMQPGPDAAARSGARDIDVAVTRGSFASVIREVERGLTSLGYRTHRRRRWEAVQIYAWDPADAVAPVVNVDLVRHVQWKGIDYLDVADMVASAVTGDDGVRYVDRGVMRLYEALRGLLWHGVCDSAEASEVATWLGRAAQAGGSANAPPQRDGEASSLRRLTLLRTLVRYPARSLAGVAGWRANQLRALLRPDGTSVVLLGVDGSGKSSVAAALVEGRVRGLFNPVGSVSVHWRPGVLPKPSALMGGPTTVSPEVVERPHDQTPYGPVRTLIRALYFWADYVLGWWPVVRMREARSGIVVFDRYAPDVAVDPLRYRMDPRLAGLLEVLFVRSVPRPCTTVVLDVSPEGAEARRGDGAADATGALCAGYAHAAAAWRAHTVDADQDLGTVVRQVESILLEEYFGRG